MTLAATRDKGQFTGSRSGGHSATGLAVEVRWFCAPAQVRTRPNEEQLSPEKQSPQQFECSLVDGRHRGSQRAGHRRVSRRQFWRAPRCQDDQAPGQAASGGSIRSVRPRGARFSERPPSRLVSGGRVHTNSAPRGREQRPHWERVSCRLRVNQTVRPDLHRWFRNPGCKMRSPADREGCSNRGLTIGAGTFARILESFRAAHTPGPIPG